MVDESAEVSRSLVPGEQRDPISGYYHHITNTVSASHHLGKVNKIFGKQSAANVSSVEREFDG